MTDTSRSPARTVPGGHSPRPLDPPLVSGAPTAEAPVPLSVWYPPAGGSADDGDLIRQVVTSYSACGQVVLDLDRDALVAAVVLAAGRAYETGSGVSDAAREQPAGGAHLALVSWPPSGQAPGSIASENELVTALRSHLRVAGHAVIVFRPSSPGPLDAGRAAALIVAAARVGLGYRQSVVYLTGGVSGNRLAEGRPHPPVSGYAPDWRDQAHRLLLVLFVRAGRRG